VVSILLKENLRMLDESYNQALRRLISLKARLQRDPMLRKQYVAFLTEYENLQHMSRMTDPDIAQLLR